MDARDKAGKHLRGCHDRKTPARRYGPTFDPGLGFSGRSGGAEGGRERSETDRLIEELMDESPRRGATPEEIVEIVAHLSKASFDRRELPVKKRLRGLSYGGYTLGEREDSLVAHFVQRVVIDKQWAEGTTEEQYVEDLRACATRPLASPPTGRRRAGTQRRAAPIVGLFARAGVYNHGVPG